MPDKYRVTITLAFDAWKEYVEAGEANNLADTLAAQINAQPYVAVRPYLATGSAR